MNIIFNAIKKLLPIGFAWNLISDCIKYFVEGISLEPERLKGFYSDVRNEDLPETANNLLPEWYKALGIPYNETLPLEDRQAKAKARDTALGGQDIIYLQKQIDDANIDVEIVEIFPPDYARTGIARCGAARCFRVVVPVSSPESAICGVARTGIARTGLSEFGEVNDFLYYLLVGEVKDREEFAQLLALLQYIAPAHLEPIYEIDLLSAFARTGVAVCNISRVNYAYTFQPTQISNCILWLDAEDDSTITKDGSNNISQWDDKSTSGYNATQAVLADQPFYNEGFFNSKPTVNFRDNTDRFEIIPIGIPQPWTAIFLVNGIDPGARSLLFDWWTYYSIRYEQSNNTNKLGFTKYIAPTTHYTSNISTPYNIWKPVIFQGYDNKVWFKLDDQVDSIPFNFPMPLEWLRLFKGHFAEILAYDKNLSDSELAQIKEYFDAKWGTT